jgi:hypothetical protein
LRKDDWIRDLSTPVVVVSSSSMARAKQERVVRFLKGGGRVLIMPVIPVVDENLDPCTLLSDFLGSPALDRNPNVFARVTILGVQNILDNIDNFFTPKLPAGATALGKDEHTNRILAWELTTEGGGRAIFLGFRWLHAMREHSLMLGALLERLGLQRRVECSNPNLWTSLRTNGNRSALFIMNLFTSPQEAEVRCRPAGRSGGVNMGHHMLEPMSVKYVEV